jgi:hypothetical protein
LFVFVLFEKNTENEVCVRERHFHWWARDREVARIPESGCRALLPCPMAHARRHSRAVSCARATAARTAKSFPALACALPAALQVLTMPKFMDRHCIDSRSRDLRRRPKAGLGRRCSRLRRRAAEHRSRPGCSTAVPPPSTGRLQKPLSGFCARSRRYVPNVRPLSAPPRAMLVV